MSVASPVVETWDGENRRIFLKQGITEFHWVDDIYTEYRNERRTNENLRKFEGLLRASGNESKGQGRFTSRFVTLTTDDRGITTKVVPYDESGEINANGEAITDVADTDPKLFDITTLSNPMVINYQPPNSEVITVNVNGGGTGDISEECKEDIANRVVEKINNPVVIDTLEKFNAIETYLKRKYIDFNLTYNIVLNQNHLDTLESELSKDNLTVLYTSKVRLNIEIDNSIQNFDFRVYGLNTK